MKINNFDFYKYIIFFHVMDTDKHESLHFIFNVYVYELILQLKLLHTPILIISIHYSQLYKY